MIMQEMKKISPATQTLNIIVRVRVEVWFTFYKMGDSVVAMLGVGDTYIEWLKWLS